MFSQKLLTLCLIFSTAGGSAALAQNIPQDPISRAATQVQQQAAAGQISQKEAGQISGKLWQLKNEEQQDLARHGGILTPQDNQRLWSEIHNIEGNTNFNGNRWQHNPHRSSYANQGYSGYGNGYNNGYNGGYGNGYNGYGNGYNGGYGNQGYNPYQNGYNNSGFGLNQGGSKFSQAASVIQGLLNR